MRAALFLFLIFSCIPARAELPFAEGQRVLFLGDSITHSGTYVAMVDAALMVARPDKRYDIVSAGLSSETVSGLSEPGHADGKFPRPDLHERLDRVLAMVKPHLVIACYGMNCGIYMPLKEERFKAYREGMVRLREKVKASGADIIHLTPPVFDPQPIREKTDPTGAEGEQFTKPYTGYDEVLSAYASWLVERRAEGWMVIDLHGPMKSALDKGRAADPSFVLSKDGVHPGIEGHALMAQCILDAWGIKVRALELAQDPGYAAFWKSVQARQKVMSAAWLSAAGHKRPGVAPGLPKEEAEAKAALLEVEARAELGRIRSPSK